MEGPIILNNAVNVLIILIFLLKCTIISAVSVLFKLGIFLRKFYYSIDVFTKKSVLIKSHPTATKRAVL